MFDYDLLHGQLQTDKLDEAYFLSFMTIENGADVIKQRADELFLTILSYYTHDDDIMGLKGLGLAKVETIPGNLQAIVDSDDKAKQFYIDYSIYWIPLAILTAKELQETSYVKYFKEKYPMKIKAYQQQLVKLNNEYGDTLAKQQALLYSQALQEKHPNAYYYQECSVAGSERYFPDKLKEYLKTSNWIKSWARDVEDEIVNVEISAFKSLVDFIDPTQKISTEALQVFLGEFVYLKFQKEKKLDDTFLEKHITDTLSDLLKNSNPQATNIKEYIDYLSSVMPVMTGSAGVAHEFVALIKDLFNTDPDVLSDPTKFKTKIVNKLTNLGFTAKNLEKTSRIINCIFRVIQVSVLCLTSSNTLLIKNDEIPPLKLGVLLADCLYTTLDAASSFSKVDNYVTRRIGQYWAVSIGRGLNWVYKGLGNVVYLAFTVDMKRIFTAKFSSFVAQRLAPCMLLLSAVNSFIDYLDTKDSNPKAAYIDLSSSFLALGGGLGVLLLLYYGVTGPVGLIVAVVGLLLIGLGLIKFIFFSTSEEDKEYFRDFYIRNLIPQIGDEVIPSSSN
ncbi:hypothetical protein DLAC_06635 [Tieghemostelium lacteum]|uniref:Uncharacterized protein n=1 Tax=Tieghemostelium lacteum TaxID=361077 RepID=A0A151ZFF1_TIELA|nr:hypothetical protein DLAC_06635 [Tieghemostelium lacteum]|eukprot:KYQ92639.1 hypothetical protein DLAC_06635 [Tieghemostelium lacteum]